MLKTVETLLGRDTLFPDSVLFTKVQQTDQPTEQHTDRPTTKLHKLFGTAKQVVKLVVGGSVINGATPSILTTLQP